jgi:hypothetical protein
MLSIAAVTVIDIASFPDTPEGNEEAAALFAEWVQEQSPEVVGAALNKLWDDGIFRFGSGDIIVIHSVPQV